MTANKRNEGQRCTAHARSGKRCGSWPVAGATVCRMHGGSAPQVRAAAKRRLLRQAAEDEAEALLAFEGLDGVVDPLELVSQLAAKSDAMLRALGVRVNDLEDIRYTTAGGVEQLRAEVTLYERALDRTARLLKILIGAGYAERRARIDEEIAAALISALDQVAEELGLTREQQTVLPALVHRAIAAETPTSCTTVTARPQRMGSR